MPPWRDGGIVGRGGAVHLHAPGGRPTWGGDHPTMLFQPGLLVRDEPQAQQRLFELGGAGVAVLGVQGEGRLEHLRQFWRHFGAQFGKRLQFDGVHQSLEGVGRRFARQGHVECSRQTVDVRAGLGVP